MAKALIGHLDSDLRISTRLTAENRRLRVRVGELEDLVLRLQQDNDRLVDARVDGPSEAGLPEMQPV
jgi:hypothetical protein